MHTYIHTSTYDHTASDKEEGVGGANMIQIIPIPAFNPFAHPKVKKKARNF